MTRLSQAMSFFFSKCKALFAISASSSCSSTIFPNTCQEKDGFPLHSILDNNRKGKESLFFKAAEENDVELLRKLIGEDMIDPHTKGALGENVLHVAALYNNQESLVTILDAYPSMINKPMDCDLYKGETALHIAIVNQNFEIVKELLARKADTENSRAIGQFFAAGNKGQCYYGEYPLSFAACIGNKEVFQFLVENGAPLHSQDTEGNTVLHMLVLHPNKFMACKMYDFLISLTTKENVRRLESIMNKQGFTPLKLAAHEGNMLMFQYLVKKKRRAYWTLGPMTVTLYDLTGIDSWNDRNSVLDIICNSKNNEVRNLLKVTPVKELLHYKWTHYGYKYFLLWTMLYILYTIVLTVCCLYRPLKAVTIEGEEIVTIKVLKPLNETYQAPEDFVRLAGEILTVLGAFLILFTEVAGLLRDGPRQFFGNTMKGGPFHLTMLLYAGFIVTILIMRLAGSTAETVITPMALLSAWCSVIYFARGFRFLGPLCIMIQKMIFGDLLRFCIILIIVIIGFSAAFDVHFQAMNQTVFPHFSDFPITTFTLFQLMMGLTNLPIPSTVNMPTIITILYLVYMFFAYILLLNLVIALMGDTHFRVSNQRKTLWKAQITATTLLLERRVPNWLWPRTGIPGEILGLEEGKWYLRVEERNTLSKKNATQRKENLKIPSGKRNCYLAHADSATSI
ncbi:transient receptor potential cation channel subfamily V member 6 [Microcaecilia unicolor]|uniref:Transient receptor potential cation channel subfamily V member 6-like n=1 Tax=Microcaecilia unicolor TaxID=1415580 RepID=A0A6P7YZW8_9AMPH|nr:transient receptor potential cation channel subfamily V member 6-like [Microcaecilia unicolor]